MDNVTHFKILFSSHSLAVQSTQNKCKSEQLFQNLLFKTNRVGGSEGERGRVGGGEWNKHAPRESQQGGNKCHPDRSGP